MNIGIIGIGAIGGTIAKKLAKAGHTVKVANSRGKDAVKDFAAEIGASPSDLLDIGADADVLIISIPYGAIPDLPGSVFASLSKDAIVVDTGNFYPEVRNEKIDGLGEGQTESVWLSMQIHRPVIKAFNTLLAYSLAGPGKEKGAEGRQSPLIVAVQSPEYVQKVSYISAALMGFQFSAYYGAPTIILVFETARAGDAEMGIIDASAVCTNMVNAAYAVGLGSCWIHRCKEVFETLEGKALLREWGITEPVRGVASIASGYANCPHPKARARREGYVVKV